MFQKNDVISWRDVSYRLLAYVDDEVVLFPMAESGITVVKEKSAALSDAERNGTAKLLEDPYFSLQHKTPQGKAFEKMEQNYALIKPLIDGGDEMLVNGSLRSRTLNEIGGGNLSQRRKAVRVLSAYWKKGQTENALQPEFGKNTAPRNCLRKSGRRFSAPGVNPPPVNDELRRLFSRIIDRYMLKSDGLSLAGAHARLVSEYIESHPGATADTAPTYNQFRYFYRTYKSFPEKLRAMTPEGEYDKDKRTLLGNVYDIVDGIGQIYEIDATKPSVYLVSELDRSVPIGQPTLYLVTDVYSHMIVGVHVAIESAQFETAAAALVNAIGDKADYLAANSDNLVGSDWPASGMPATVTADNAELSGRQIEAFCRSCCVRISNTKAYRGDQKGMVERSLGLVQSRIDPMVAAQPSKVTLRKEGAKDMRGEATLTLSDYRKLVLNAVVDLNNRPLSYAPPGYPPKRNPTPKDIWAWCRETGGGKSYLRRAPKEDLLKRSLMPRFEATVSREGIRAEQITYVCERAAELGWFERDRHAPRPKAPLLAIDPTNAGKAWVFETADTPPAEAWPCSLSAADKELEGIPLFEVRARKSEQSRSAARAERAHKEIQGRMHRANEAIARAAKKAKPKTKESLKSQLEGLAENRSAERGYQARKSQGAQAPQAKRIKPKEPANPYELPDDLEDLE